MFLLKINFKMKISFFKIVKALSYPSIVVTIVLCIFYLIHNSFPFFGIFILLFLSFFLPFLLLIDYIYNDLVVERKIVKHNNALSESKDKQSADLSISENISSVELHCTRAVFSGSNYWSLIDGFCYYKIYFYNGQIIIISNLSFENLHFRFDDTKISKIGHLLPSIFLTEKSHRWRKVFLSVFQD
jgi:hypothetical protein